VKAVLYRGAGGNDVVDVVERAEPQARGEHVLVRVRFAGLNPADIQQREGRYPAPAGAPADIPGLEVAGAVEECGERVSDWQVGDRVFGLVAGGGLASRVLVHERCLARIPGPLEEREAAAIPEAFVTAHDAVAVQARLRPCETLVVHGASGGVGTAAIQIGTALSAHVLAVTRSAPARSALEALGADVLDEERFEADVLERSKGRGADVVLELVGAPHFPADLEILAPRGRLVVVGVGAGHEVGFSLLRLMQKRAQLIGTVLRHRPLEEKALAMRGFESEVVPLLASGRARPIIDSVFPAERIREAFERLATPGRVGKVLVEF
jgi:NADPH2:quinone reductase